MIEFRLHSPRATSLNKYAVYDNSRNTSSIYLFSVGYNNPASDIPVACTLEALSFFTVQWTTVIAFYSIFNILRVTDHKILQFINTESLTKLLI